MRVAFTAGLEWPKEKTRSKLGPSYNTRVLPVQCFETLYETDA